MSKKTQCGTPIQYGQLHSSIRIGGVVVERCTRLPLPRMTVCEYHASPEAVRIVMNSFVDALQEKKKVKRNKKKGGL